MLRSFFIYLSKAAWARKIVTGWSFAWRAASRFSLTVARSRCNSGTVSDSTIACSDGTPSDLRVTSRSGLRPTEARSPARPG